MSNVLIVSPHPDDETLGCGGSIFYHKKRKDNVSLLYITNIKKEHGWSEKVINKRKKEMEKISKFYKLNKVINLNLPTKKLDIVPYDEIIKKISSVISKYNSEIIYIPFANDIHTDHQIVSKACLSSIKWFRNKSVIRVLGYETLSETNFNFGERSFNPNVFINISQFLKKKISAMKIYKSEISKHPFPRSEKSIRALALLRGSQCGKKAAEAFELYYEKI